MLDTFGINRLSQHGGGGGAVAGDVGGLGSDFLDHLGAHVFKMVVEFDFLGDGDAVLGDGRRTEFLVQAHIAAPRSQRYLDGVSQLIDAFAQFFARLGIIFYNLRHFI
jgi:hypothetical protein